jgi:succinate-semialdehyde dehydrogenase / glutarate-semialdehyde dehydrogenase
MKSINPATNELIREYPEHTKQEVKQIIEAVHTEWLSWRETSIDYRAGLFRNAAAILRKNKDEYAKFMTSEMGKIISEAQAEVEKCATGCDYYAEHAASLLQDQVVKSDASRSLVVFQPLGVILAVMPWNFPFWQVFRFAAPSLMAGNTAVLKHASNVPGCALAIGDVFRKAGFPENVFRTLMIPSSMVEDVVAHPYIVAATLTGSEGAGKSVASLAGQYLKKTVLELGGSDACIVLEDADLELAVRTSFKARMINQGQSCIAAKRFIIMKSVADEFTSRMKAVFEQLKTGDPIDPETQVGPLARPDLADDIEKQVNKSIRMGAVLVTGGKRAVTGGCWYQPTILTNVKKGMPVYSEETFGPVISIIIVDSEEEAIAVANDSEFGLGGSVFTRDVIRGESVARKVHTGAMFVNGLVKSDPRLPFGGIRKSGYGRELSEYGIREFVNIKTIWIG